MKCVGCKADLPANTKFCPVCGRFVSKTNTGMVAPSPKITKHAVEEKVPAPGAGGRTVELGKTGSRRKWKKRKRNSQKPKTLSSVQLRNVVEPWGEVNVVETDQGRMISATLLAYEVEEGTRTCLALDGSLSMKKLYGQGGGGGFFGAMKTNEVQPVARKMSTFLADEVDCTGKTDVMYWACGNMGENYESVGELDVASLQSYDFGGPSKFGTGTRLLKPLKHIEASSRNAAFSMNVIITDGKLDDLEEVKNFTVELAKRIQNKQRNPFKAVLIGLGEEVDESQLLELDDLETNTDIDIWDHKIAGELRQMWDIFAEVVERNKILAPSGRILDQQGNVVEEYPNGLPCVLEFSLEPHVTHIVLEAAGNRSAPQPVQ